MLSPDGQWLVYGNRRDAETGLRLRNLTTGDEKWLAYPIQRDDMESRFTRDLLPGSSFTPDSRYVVSAWNGKIYRVEVATGTQDRDSLLGIGPCPHGTAGQVRVPGGYRRHPAQADPRSINLTGREATRSSTALDRLYTMDLPNGTPKRLTSDTVHEQNPVWSPDGKWVAYITWGNAGGYLQRVKSAGGKPDKLSPDPAFYQAPAWSPDGQRIVVIRGPRQARLTEAFGPGYELDWLPANGGTLTRVSPIRPGRPAAFLQPTRI